MALKVVILDEVLDSKCRKQKEQEGAAKDITLVGTAMNDIRSASPSALSRRDLVQVNVAGLTENTDAALRRGGGEIIETYRYKDLDQHRLWRIRMSSHSWGQGPLPNFTARGKGELITKWRSRL